MSNRGRVVLLIPGIFDRGKSMHRMEAVLDSAGFSAYYIHLQYNSGWYGMEFLAHQLKSQVEELVEPDQTCALVGFSMGGIVARHYIQVLGGQERVHKYISIASPHFGSVWANCLPYRGGRQLSVGSEFLARLNREIHSLEPLEPVSIWTRYDATILPHRSALLPLGNIYEVPVALHRWVPLDRRVIDIVSDELGTAPAPR
ncbi:esterase/lipase family protein [Microbulbifer sp. YPW16]|uniref:esterase/lipase family protein n=1 Tax=Microbulbifer sp. YPW16 TaxID=2904242 RepID=UPI001E28B9BD|nr:alpha/beta fold hydrolase [Microbulbifer sp. YPW16]UHQ53704.1 lipase [Microbulbifer sp. YPW16]